MEPLKITSRDNRTVKDTMRLISSVKARREEGLFVVEGLRLCEDAMLSGLRFLHLFVSDTALKRQPDVVVSLEKNADKVYYVNDSLYAYMSDTMTPQGVMAVIPKPQLCSELDKNGKYIALECVQDPANLGAVARSAEAFGISGLVLSADCCDAFSPKALRASMGALFRIPIIVTDDIIEIFSSENIRTFACVVDSSARPINSVEFSCGSAAIIGNEGNGLKPETAAAASERITIPMKGRAESLNAAVAAAITIWEMQRN